MVGRIVEVADDSRHLNVYRGFLVVKSTGENSTELGRIPLDDIEALIANAHGLSYTNNLLVALAERGAPMVICGANHNVAAMLISVDGNYQQAKRFDAQIAVSKPKRKQLWTVLVKAKLQQQAAVLAAIGAPDVPLTALIEKVRSGDPDNIEAQAARRYWSLLFGTQFRRDRDTPGINSLLNYAYTVLRASVARSVVAAGLHPTLGIHHQNEGNAMRLVDDLIEPFRPLMDIKVWQLALSGRTDLSPDVKRELVHVLYADMHTVNGLTPVSVAVQKLATSLAQFYLGETEKLELPLGVLPIDLLE